MNKEREIRYIPFENWAEMRAEEREDGTAVITGRPIVFNQITDLGPCREVILVSALDKADLRDVPLLCQHDFGMIPLARSRNNNENSTMQLSVNDNGMDIRVDLDIENNPRAKELYSAVKRGDISGMSFMFTVDKDAWEDLESDQPLRRITAISRVFEVSAVTFPAYEGTNIQAASEDSALESARASLESARKQAEEDRAAQAEQERRTALLERLNNLTKEGSDE